MENEKVTNKRFWLFAGMYYYPNGGMSDFKGSFNNEEDALEYYEDYNGGDWFEWCQILDTKNSSWKGFGEKYQSI